MDLIGRWDGTGNGMKKWDENGMEKWDGEWDDEKMNFVEVMNIVGKIEEKKEKEKLQLAS